MPKPDPSLLSAALVGYQHRLAEIDTQISQIKAALGGRAVSPDGGGGDVPRRRFSAAARKRIAEAQRKRWAAFRRGKKP